MTNATAFHKVATACFVETWVVLGIAGFFLFSLGRNVAQKRNWFPRYVILVGVLFVVFSTTLMTPPSRSSGTLGMLALVISAVSLISYLNIKFTKFCDKCGATLYHQNWHAPMKFCSRCGAGLDPKPAGHDDLLD